MKNWTRNALVALAVLGSPLCPLALAGEIPADLGRDVQISEKTGQGSGVEVGALDRVELAELSKSDPSQKGGDVVSVVVLVAAILILLIIL